MPLQICVHKTCCSPIPWLPGLDAVALCVCLCVCVSSSSGDCAGRTGHVTCRWPCLDLGRVGSGQVGAGRVRSGRVGSGQVGAAVARCSRLRCQHACGPCWLTGCCLSFSGRLTLLGLSNGEWCRATLARPSRSLSLSPLSRPETAQLRSVWQVDSIHVGLVMLTDRQTSFTYEM